METTETDAALDVSSSTASAPSTSTTAAIPPPVPPPAPSSSSAPGGDTGQLNYPPLPPADVVVASRCGDVLTRATLLKSDHFPGCQNRRLRPLVEGAPNFRRVPGLPVFGVAIPTAAGLRRALEAAGAGPGGRDEEKGGGEEDDEGKVPATAAASAAASAQAPTSRRKVLWHNLREEPVIYINGRPFVVRDAAAPFANLEYTGIDRARVEDMEARLRADVLREAAVCGSGAVLVAHEGPDFAVVEEWEPVTDADVQTPADVYRVRSFDFGESRFTFFLFLFFSKKGIGAELFSSPTYFFPLSRNLAFPDNRSSSPTATTSTTSASPSPTKRPPKTPTSTSYSPAAGGPRPAQLCFLTARWGEDARQRE